MATVLLAARTRLRVPPEISSRFAALIENVRHFGAGEQLDPLLRDGDEIADLDAAFRDMAAALTRSTDLLGSPPPGAGVGDTAPCGYHSIDGDGTYVAISKTELRWLGYTAEEVIRRMKLRDVR